MTRCDLVSKYARQAWSGTLCAVSTDGGMPVIQVIESAMHDLLRADDALTHQTRDNLMIKLAPHMMKGRKR